MAENHIQPDKMAVNSVEQQSAKSSHSENRVEENDLAMKDNVNFQNPQDNLYCNTRKKSSFQITRVITKSGGSDHADGEVDDDLDETNTEEVSSELLDISKTTDTDHDPPSEDTISAHSIPASSEDFQKDINSSHIPSSSTPQVSYQQNHIGFQPVNTQSKAPSSSIPQDIHSDKLIIDDFQETEQNILVPIQSLPEQGKEKSAESRFKVVKIQSEEPFRRGRWQCLDYLTPPSNERSEKNEEVGSHGSGSSSAASSVHYVPGVDDPSRNPLLEGQIINVSQNGEFNGSQSQTFSGSQSTYSNGTHIMTNASMPSQHIPTQVPTTLTQTHMQNVLPQASVPEPVSQQFTSNQVNQPSSSSAGNGQVSHAQGAQSQSSFSQSSMPSQSANQSVTQQSQNVNSDKEFIPPTTTDFIPSTNTQQNAQKPQEASSQSQSSNNNSDFKSPTNGGLQKNVPVSQSSTQPSDFVPKTVPSNGQSNSTSPSNENVHYNKNPKNNENSKEFSKKQDTTYSNTAEAESAVQAESESSDQRSEDISMKLSAVQLMGLTFDIPNKSDDEGGASTVAIDNKIEQAMDLVKSHLMYAVREEVEVLREQIKELLEKNSQLEYENQILKKAASPETLAKIQQPRPPHSLTQAPPSTTSS